MSGEIENYSKQNYTQDLHQKDKHIDCPLWKIVGTNLTVDDGRTSTNEPENKNLMTIHKALHIDRRCVSKKEGRGRARI